MWEQTYESIEEAPKMNEEMKITIPDINFE
jgi:hypothetical protein